MQGEVDSTCTPYMLLSPFADLVTAQELKSLNSSDMGSHCRHYYQTHILVESLSDVLTMYTYVCSRNVKVFVVLRLCFGSQMV